MRCPRICHWLPPSVLQQLHLRELSFPNLLNGAISFALPPRVPGLWKWKKQREKMRRRKHPELSSEKIETFKHVTQSGIGLSFKVQRASAFGHLCQPSTIYVASAGSMISAPQFPCQQNGDIVPISQGDLRSEPAHLGRGAMWSLDSGPACGKGPLPASPAQAPGPQVVPPPTRSSSPHQNEPHWAGGLGELKHAIKQLLDGKCFRNFRLHLLLNLILSSDAHYARDGISCGLPVLRTPAGGSPHLDCCSCLSTA